MHYLSFIILSPLDDKIIETLGKYGPQIGRISNLNNEESFYLLLLTKSFLELFFKRKILDFNSYVQIFDNIGINISEFFENIKKIHLTSIKILEEKMESKPSIQKILPVMRPKTPDEKISNPSKLEPHIIKHLEEKELLRTKQMLIDGMIPLAKSQSVIINAISNLQKNILVKNLKVGA